jgi:diguanylate cyclase (GGDEF)-like protein
MGVATATAIGLCAWLIGGWGGESTVRVVDNLGLPSFAVFALVCAGLAARSARGRQRKAWICLAIGLAGWAAGEVIWGYYQLVLGMEEAPFPSLADAGYLMFPVGACLALVLFPTGYSRQSRARLVLDGLIIAGALFEVSWVTVLNGVYEAGGASRFAVGLSLAYPVSDVVVVTVALLVVGRAQTRQRTTLVLLLVGNVLNALSDSAFVYLNAHEAYNSGNLIDIGWIAALLALSSAALVSRQASHVEEQEAEMPSRASLWMPYPPLALAVLVCLPEFTPLPGLGPLLVTSVLLVFVFVGRQFIVVGQNRRLLAMVADQALRDPLTGLANRVLFNDRLTHAMQLRQRDNHSVAVLSLDLDDFKLVNDSLGHAAGDAVLILVAERIVCAVRTGDTVARLGGDEFAVLLEGPAEHSRLVAHRVVQAFDEPFLIDGRDVMVKPSVGLAVIPADDSEISPDALLKQADVAMYSAKRSRSGGVHTFTADMHLLDLDERGGTVGLRLLGQLRQAIDNVDLTLVYQPKFALRTDEIVGVEALVRWPHPERGLLAPDQFLPLVRQHGLMRSVTEHVLNKALDDAANWHSKGVGVPVAVNLFAPSLSDLRLPAWIMRALADRGLGSNALTVEITEDILLDNIDRTLSVLNKLRENGIRVSIDDFGSGYSALWYLRDLPIDEVKLDKDFIAPILVDRRAAAIVRAVIDLAHELGVTTVAEGVEDADTVARLREYGCEMAQGYFCSPPLAAEAIGELLMSSELACCPRENGSPPVSSETVLRQVVP